MPESMLWVAKYHSQERSIPMFTLVHHMTHLLARMAKLPVNEFGVLEATRENALAALDAGYAVTVYPGGDRDVARSYADRHKVNFFDHLGYAKMAIKAQVPILPVVGCGGGETLFVIDNGERIAEFTGLKKWAKVHTWPFYWSFPFGFHWGHFPHIEVPLPSQITMSVLPPIHLPELSTSDADDPEVLKAVNELVLTVMQDELDRLSKGRIPIIGKL